MISDQDIQRWKGICDSNYTAEFADAKLLYDALNAIKELIVRIKELEADVQYANHFREDCISAWEYVARLEREAEWLAEQLSEAANGGFAWETKNAKDSKGVEMWREAARRATRID